MKLKTYRKAEELYRMRREKEDQRKDFLKALSALIAPREGSRNRNIRVTVSLFPEEKTVWISRAALIDLINHEIPRVEHEIMEIEAEFAALDDNVVDRLNQEEET